MSKIKRTVLIITVVFVGALNVLIYYNFHLYYKAGKTEDIEKKIKILERANRAFSYNDLTFYELGKAYFELGQQTPGAQTRSKILIQKSVQNFNKSIKINPASYFSHFNLARSLMNLSSISEPLDQDFYDEYKKAALLAGENNDIYYETGKVYLSNWNQLSDEDKNFTKEILKKIGLGKNRQKIHNIFDVWQMNIQEYEVITEILPEEPQIYRWYADFLGQKSLSLHQRHKMLAAAEFLDFEKARRDYDSGELQYFYFRQKKAAGYYKSCLERLKRIKFYQKLSNQSLIDSVEFIELQKSALLKFAKSNIEQGTELEKVEDYLREYLSLTGDRVVEVEELESYLIERGLIKKNLTAALDDLDLLSFQLLLDFKQTHHRDIVNAGNQFRQGILRIPEGKKEKYVEVLQYFGDSFHRFDNLYEAEDFYKMALEIDPDNIRNLIKIRQIYGKLNKENKISEINSKIEKVLSSKEIVLEDVYISKSKRIPYDLQLDGRRILLNLFFKDVKRDIRPLIHVFFNDQIIWEDYLDDDILSIHLESKIGENHLQIGCVNRNVALMKFTYRF